MTDNISILDYSEHLHKNVNLLVNNGRIGFSKFQRTHIQSKPNKFLEMTKGFRNYHFCIEVPYAGRILNWEIIFDPEDFSQLPDFDFNDDSFLPEPDINYIAENVPSWDTWDLTNSNSILNILNEFLSLYKKAQVERLFKQNKFLNLKKEYENLLAATNLPADKVEVLIETKHELHYDESTDDFVVVNFLIILPIDFRRLPEYHQGEGDELLNPGEDFAHLHVQIKKLDNSQTKVGLTMGPRAEQLLGKLKLPKFRKDAALSDFAQAVQLTIENQINVICHQHETRSLFVSSIVNTFSSGIVEYDSSRFYKVSFIYDDFEDYDSLVTIQLGGKFPQERPKVQLHSLYCQVGRSCNTFVIYHLYDPQGTLEENMRGLREILHQEVKLFQNHKH